MNDYRLTFLLTEPKEFTFFSWIIKKRIRRNYCHVAVIPEIIDESGLKDVYQAAHGLVHAMESEYFFDLNKIVKVYQVKGTHEKLIETLKFLKSNSGKSYSQAGAIACTFWILRKLKIGLDGNKQFICSEYGMGALEKFLGKDIRPEMANDYVDPALFESILSGLNENRITG